MRERPAFWKRPSHGLLKCRRGLFEFGKEGSTCERVCEAPRAVCHVLFAERVPGTMRSGWPARETTQVRCAGDVIGPDLAARASGERHTLSRVGNSPKASACYHGQDDDKASINYRPSEGTLVSPIGTNGQAVNHHLGGAKEKKKPRFQYMAPGRIWQASCLGKGSTSLAG